MSSLNEVVALIESQGTAFEQFKSRYDSRFAALEDETSELAKKVGRPFFSGGGNGGTSPEQKAKVADAVRALLAGDQRKAEGLFAEAESKGMSAGSSPEGGYVVLPQFSSEMTKVMGEFSPIYSLARTVNLDHGTRFEEVIDRDQAQASWVGELQSRSETTAPDLGLFAVDLAEICAQPKVSQTLIDTASVNIVDWLQGKVAEAFAITESAAFHSGDGVGKPRGFLDYTTVTTSDATRTWGELQHIATGASGAFPTPSTSVNSADVLVDVVAALKVQYRAGASWLMNRATAGAVRKLKDADGRHVWADSLVAEQPSMLLGYPVYESEDMPAISAGSLSIAFGNWKKAYTIVRRLGVRFLVDPFTDKPNVKLYTYARVGGGVNNTEALKLLRFS